MRTSDRRKLLRERMQVLGCGRRHNRRSTKPTSPIGAPSQPTSSHAGQRIAQFGQCRCPGEGTGRLQATRRCARQQVPACPTRHHPACAAADPAAVVPAGQAKLVARRGASSTVGMVGAAAAACRPPARLPCEPCSTLCLAIVSRPVVCAAAPPGTAQCPATGASTTADALSLLLLLLLPPLPAGAPPPGGQGCQAD